MIRNDFVSNSSSTSFCIIGNCFEEENLRKILNIPDDRDTYDFLDEYFEKNDIQLNFHRGINDSYSWYIGSIYENMLENETREEFESRIKSAIDDLTNGHADTIYCYTDGGYDS